MTLTSLLIAVALGGPPATVLDHVVDVSVDGRQKLVETVTWTVRVDDPAACAAGLIAPPGLDGATDGEAIVLEDVLVVPSSAGEGSTYTLTASRTVAKGPHSGVLRSAPDLPVVHAALSVRVPSYSPLTVWADPGAVPDYSTARGARGVTMSWTDVPAAGGTQAAWSVYPDWTAAGSGIEDVVESKLASKGQLGRDVASGLEGLGLGGIAERAFDLVALEPGPPGSWQDARPAADVAKARSGNAAERGVLLLSLLRIAGHEARPGLYRPGDGASFPVTVPAPALLPRPMIVVKHKGREVLIDPAAERASVPDMPASLLGATVWVPGEMPFELPTEGVVDGRGAVSTSFTISGDGSATWSASVNATGAASEYLRQLLGPLDDEGRTETISRLVRKGRPGTERVNVQTSGVRRTDEPIKITVSGFDPAALELVDSGVRGVVQPALAPALAAWLPPRLQILETVSVTPPPTVTILGSSLEAFAFQQEAMVGRRYGREGERAVLDVEVQRPYRRTTPAIDAAATAFLDEQAKQGVELLMFVPASAATAKSIAASERLTDADQAVLTAQLWWSANQDKKARKVLTKALTTVGFEALLAGVAHYAQPGDMRPWKALDQLAAEDDARRMKVVEGMEERGLVREAWLASVPLQSSVDPDVRIRALLLAERLQGPRPDPSDEAAVAAWKPSQELLGAAASIAAADPRVRFRQAELALQAGDTATGEALLDQVRAAGQGGPLVDAMAAFAAAQVGIPKAEVTERIRAAVAGAPTDPQVISFAAAATAAVGAHDDALVYALTAARIANDDIVLWEKVAHLALAASDLGTSVYAARRASDLDPSSAVRARVLRDLGILALDREAADLGASRCNVPVDGPWPPSLEERLKIAPDEAVLGMLDVAEADVSAEPRMLAMRAQMRIDAGRLEEGARDGVYLASRYAWKEGWALAFAGTAGRQFSTELQKRLDEASSQTTARMVRMEYSLIAGNADPLRDARGLEGDDRAEALLAFVKDPAASAKQVPGWPSDMVRPTAPVPRGYRVNKVLQGSGVQAWSNPDGGVAILRAGAITGLLPAPLHQLYTVHPQPLVRLENGGQVIRLDGGIIPLYAAIAFDGEHEVYGLGFSAEAARNALRDAGL